MGRGGGVGAELCELDGFFERGDGPDHLDDTGEAGGDSDTKRGGGQVSFVEVEEDCAGDDLEDVEDDGEPFEEKMGRLIAKLDIQFQESTKLEKSIRENLKGLKYVN